MPVEHLLAVQKNPIGETARKYLSICVLDDESALVEVTTERLRTEGFEAVGTGDPRVALEMVRAGRCRAVLTDVKMPAMDGFEFLEKALHSDPGIYVILVTGMYSLDSAIDAIKRGASDYLCKTLDFSRLVIMHAPPRSWESAAPRCTVT